MRHLQPSEPSAVPAEDRPERGDGDDPSVEPVAARPGGEPRATTLTPRARLERRRRLALEARVAALEGQLERAERRREAVLEHYEELLQERDDDDPGPTFSWLRRP
jgi:hypothetical protein